MCAKNRCVTAGPVSHREVELEADGRLLPGMMAVPSAALGVVAFAHGSGSSRTSPRNQEVAAALNGCRLATLLFDLLSEDEAAAAAAAESAASGEAHVEDKAATAE